MRAFGEANEFKMSRLMLLFAHGAFVVSEAMGCPEDVDYYRPGMVEFASPLVALPDVVDDSRLLEFVAVVRYYLQDDASRVAIAAEGRRLFTARRMSESLAAALDGASVGDTLTQSCLQRASGGSH